MIAVVILIVLVTVLSAYSAFGTYQNRQDIKALTDQNRRDIKALLDVAKATVLNSKDIYQIYDALTQKEGEIINGKYVSL